MTLPESLIDEIGRLVAAAEPEEAAIDRLALAAFAYQFERVAPFRALCERRGRTPADVSSWREIPLVPTGAFATSELCTDPPVETFRSSGTLGAERSVHRHAFPDLYRAVIESCLRDALPIVAERPPVLSLVPSREVTPDSSLGFLVDHLLRRFAGAESVYGFGARGIEIGFCRSWLGAGQRRGRPVMVFATAFALADLVERLARMNLHFRLPAGSVVVETGGFKGRTRTVDRAELAAGVGAWLGVPEDRIVSEYGMCELTSHAYTRRLSGGDADRFVPPPWMRVRALDPVSLAELPDGERGLLAIFDLANVGSALHVLTEDLGRTDGGGFRLDGRAPESDLRGCSLLAEELASG